jgi:hypothetical protein
MAFLPSPEIRRRNDALGALMSNYLERATKYRTQAASLLRISEKQPDARRRGSMLDLAATYHHLADQLEEIHRMGDQPRGPR